MITINWNDLSINKITNLFLYGQLDTPLDLQNEALIRQPEVGPTESALTGIWGLSSIFFCYRGY